MITIITPAYNRAYTLERLYISLKSQTIKSFEWIIIDDGSIDTTEKVVQKFLDDNAGFSIVYKYKKNGGKHTAVNMGVKLAKSEFIFIVDSDDEIVADAIETIESWIKEIDSPNIAAVAGLRGKIGGGQIGGFPQKKKGGYIDAKNTDRRRLNLLGDKAEIYRTDLLRKFPFPEFEGEHFLTEACVWDEIAYQGYLVRWYDKIIYRCEYLEDGLTKSGGDQRDLNNFNGFTYSTQQRIKCNSIVDGIMAKGRYVYIAKQKGLKMNEMSKLLHCYSIELLMCNLLWSIKSGLRKAVK